MKVIGDAVNGGEGCIGDGDALGIVAVIEAAANGEAAIGSGRTDQLENDLMADERGCPPVLGDEREEAMLDLVHFEVPGGRWRMTRVRPISSASFCSSVFHNRLRLLLLPPLSAVTTRRVAWG